jgi:hypothetical protein
VPVLGRARPTAGRPAGLAVPTLVLAGEFDPVSRPAAARRARRAHRPAARVVEFPRLGHNVRHFSSWRRRVVAGFHRRSGEAPTSAASARRRRSASRRRAEPPCISAASPL